MTEPVGGRKLVPLRESSVRPHAIRRRAVPNRRKTAISLIIFSFVLSISIVATLFVFPLSRSARTHSRLLTSSDPKLLLGEANRLSSLENWYEAAPFYTKAERLFGGSGDTRNEVYARIGRIRANAEERSWDKVSNDLALQLLHPVTQSDKELRLWCLVSKAYIDFDLNIQAAKQDWTQALELAASLGDTQWLNRAKGELGIVAFLEGHAAQAESLVGGAIFSIDRPGDDVAAEAKFVSMMGNGYNEVERFSEADWFFQQAIGLLKSIPDTGFPYLAYEGQARSLFGEGKIQQATTLLTTVLSRARSEHRPDQQAQALMELGEMAMQSGDLRLAKTDLQDAVRISSSIHFTSVLAPADFDLGTLYRQAGDLREAAQSIEEGLRASRRLGAQYYLPRDLRASGELKAAQHKVREADQLFSKAEDVMEAIDINSDRANIALAAAMSETYLDHFKLAVDNGQYAQAFRILERVRGRVMLTKLLQRKSNPELPKPGPVTPAEAKLTELQLAIMRSHGERTRASLLDQLEEMERRLAFEENEASFKQERTSMTKPASLEEVQSTLGQDELLLEYVMAEPEAFCVAVTKKKVKVLPLSSGQRDIENLTTAFLQEIKSKHFDRSHASELYSALLEKPLSQFPKSRLIIMPDGLLHFLPFEALTDGSGGFVLSSYTVSYTTSGSILRALRTTKTEPVRRPLLAVGDVDYQGRRFSTLQLTEARGVPSIILRGLTEFSGMRLTNLPESREEVLALAGMAGPNTDVLLGRDATESRFKSRPLGEFRALHFAVHAMANSEFPDRAALILAPDPAGTEDGLLQAREIMRLPLNAELVTLSACETGIGTLEGEAGVLSLEDAFLMAGAKAVVATLWNVEDQSTAILMKHFYTYLQSHEDKATALAHAKRDLLERYGADRPFYWAAFVVVGEASSTVSIGAN